MRRFVLDKNTKLIYSYQKKLAFASRPSRTSKSSGCLFLLLSVGLVGNPVLVSNHFSRHTTKVVFSLLHMHRHQAFCVSYDQRRHQLRASFFGFCFKLKSDWTIATGKLLGPRANEMGFSGYIVLGPRGNCNPAFRPKAIQIRPFFFTLFLAENKSNPTEIFSFW